MSERKVNITEPKREVRPEDRNATVEGFQHLMKGELPSNAQFNEFAEKLEKGIEQPIGERSTTAHGQEVLRNVERVVQDTQNIMNKKNYDEILQHLAREMGEMGVRHGSSAGKKAKEHVKEKGGSIQKTSSDLTQSMYHLAREIIRDAQFREFIVATIDLFEDVAGQVQDKSKEKGGGVMDTLKREIRETNPEERDKMKGTRETALNTAKEVTRDVHVSPTTKEEWKRNFKNFLFVIRNNKEYRRSLRDMEHLYHQFNTISSDVGRERYNVSGDQTARVRHETKILIERFSHHSLDPVIKKYKALNSKLREDEKAKRFFKELRFVTVEDREGILSDEEVDHKANELWRTGSELREEYRYELRDLFSELRKVLLGIHNDTDVRRLREDTETLISSIFTDEQGKLSPTAFGDSLRQLRLVLTPTLLTELEKIPIPRIEGEDDKYQYAVDHLVFSGRDLIPEKVYFHVDSDIQLITKKMETEGDYRFTIEIKDIDTSAHDVDFWFKRNGTLKYEDKGVVNVEMVNAQMLSKWRVVDRNHAQSRTSDHYTDAPWCLHCDDVQVHIHSVNIHVLEAKHDFLDKMVTTLFKGAIKRNVERQATNSLRKNMDNFERRINHAIENRERRRRERDSRIPGHKHPGETTMKEDWKAKVPGQERLREREAPSTRREE